MKPTIDVRRLPLLARGGQAEIFDLGNGRVLRYPNRPQDFDRIRYEYAVYQVLANSNAVVPKVYDLIEIDGAPAIIMERLDGESMLERIQRWPPSARRLASTLAGLHHELLGRHATTPLKDTRTGSRYCILASTLLSDSLKERVVAILDMLSDGDSLCHGDFHPGNIIYRGDVSYTIDWSGASRGDFHADIAHTYLLLKVVPRVPGLNPLLHFVQTRIGRAIATTYLNTLGTLRKIDWAAFSRWVVVKAAERTYYGLPSEKARLLGFLNESLESLRGGARPESLYRLL